MRNSILFVLALLGFLLIESCETRTPEYFECSSSPNSPCEITQSSNNSNYSISISAGPHNKGDEITIELVSNGNFSFGQAKSVDLFCNERSVYNFGNVLNFISNQRTVTLPNNIFGDHCFTIRVTREGATFGNGDDELWVSEPFIIN